MTSTLPIVSAAILFATDVNSQEVAQTQDSRQAYIATMSASNNLACLRWTNADVKSGPPMTSAAICTLQSQAVSDGEMLRGGLSIRYKLVSEGPALQRSQSNMLGGATADIANGDKAYVSTNRLVVNGPSQVVSEAARSAAILLSSEERSLAGLMPHSRTSAGGPAFERKKK